MIGVRTPFMIKETRWKRSGVMTNSGCPMPELGVTVDHDVSVEFHADISLRVFILGIETQEHLIPLTVLVES